MCCQNKLKVLGLYKISKKSFSSNSSLNKIPPNSVNSEIMYCFINVMFCYC